MRRLLCFILLLTALPALAKNAVITEIESKRDRGFDYLDIYSSEDVRAKGLLLENQLVLDFAGATISSQIKITQRKSTRIKNIRAFQYNAAVARVVIDLKAAIDYDVVHVFGRAKTVVEISDRIDEAEKIIAAWEKQELAQTARPLKTQKFLPALAGADQTLRGKVIVVDPGHGGRDPGATSLSSVQEKGLTFQTAKYLVDDLTAAGATVFLTRGGDHTSSLKNIVAFTNQTKPALFISIHYNYSVNSGVGGTETYYYTSASRRLALAVHEALTDLGRKDRGLRRAAFYAIYHARVPAILIEPLYLSNYNDEKLARSPEFQEKIAKGIMLGVKNYFRTR